MLRYSLAELGRQRGRAKGTTALLQPVPARLAAEADMLKALRTVLTGLAAEVRQTIIPVYAYDLQQRRAERKMMGDGPRPTWFQHLAAIMTTLNRRATDMVNRILNLEAKRYDDGFMAEVKRSIGIDLRAVIHSEDLGDVIEAAMARNVSLITSLSQDMVKRVEQVVIENSLAGNSVKTLKSKLVEQFGIGERKAKLIARDQMSKFHADLDELRQTQAGITEYDWASAHDERTRPLHQRLDGTRYKWGKPTGAEDGLPPGKPILCRCRARAVIVF